MKTNYLSLRIFLDPSLFAKDHYQNQVLSEKLSGKNLLQAQELMKQYRKLINQIIFGYIISGAIAFALFSLMSYLMPWPKYIGPGFLRLTIAILITIFSARCSFKIFMYFMKNKMLVFRSNLKEFENQDANAYQIFKEIKEMK